MVKYLTEPQQRELLRAARAQSCPLAQRDYHWMAVLVLTGMRITEFSRLTTARVERALATGWLISPKEDCKGKRRANSYFVTAQLKVHLGVLLGMSRHDAVTLGEFCEGEQPLIWGRVVDGKAGHLSVRSYEARMKLHLAAAGLDTTLSPHALRHSRGMNILKNHRGTDAVKVAQVALNHESIRSTGIYLHMNREEYAKAIQLVDARGRLAKRDALALESEVRL